MAESEELRLTVTLADNASAGLARLRAELSQLGGGASGAGMERMRRQTDELQRSFIPMIDKMGSARGAMSTFSAGAGVAGAAIVALGYGVYSVGQKLKQFSDQMLALNNLSRQTGFSAGQIKGVIDQLEQFGVSGAAATSNIQNFSASLADLGRTGSELRQRLMGQAADKAGMEMFVNRILGFRDRNDLAGAMNEIVASADEAFANALAQGRSQVEAADVRRRFLGEFNLTPDMLNSIRQLRSVTSEQEAATRRQIQLAQEFNREWVKTGQLLRDGVLVPIQTALLPLFTRMNIAIQESGESWATTIGDRVKTTVEEIQRLIGYIRTVEQATGSWQGFKQWWSGAPAGAAGEGGGGAAAGGGAPAAAGGGNLLARGASRLRSALGFGGGGAGGGGAAAGGDLGAGATLMSGGGGTGAPAGGGGGGGAGSGGAAGGGDVGAMGGGGGGLGGGIGPSMTGLSAGTQSGASPTATAGPAGDSNVPSSVLEQARAVALESGPGGVDRFLRKQGYPRNGAWCGSFAASVVKSQGLTPPKNPEVASNWRNFGEAVTGQPQPGDIAVRKGKRTGATGSHVTFVESVDPTTGKFNTIGGNQGLSRAQRQQGLTGQSRYALNQFDFRRAADGQLGGGDGLAGGIGRPPAEGDGGGQPLTARGGRVERGALEGRLQTLIQGSALEGQVPSDAARYGIKTGSSQEWASLMTAMAEKESSFDPALGNVSKKERAISAGAGSHGLFQLSPEDARTYGIQKTPFTMKQLRDPETNAAAAVQIAAKRAKAGGIGGSEGLAKYWAGQKGYLARGQVGVDRAALDRDMDREMTSKVEGTGKLTVDVNAPRGTKVGAEGNGLFKKVEMNRQTQMEPSRAGPTEPMAEAA